MRWTPSIMTGLACLATGLVAGYFLPRHSDSPSTDRTESSDAKRPAKTQTVYAYNFPKTESASHQSPEVLRTIPPPDDYQARSEWLAKLPTSDLAQLVAGLCNDAGPEGLESGDTSLLGNALERWWNEDSAALLSWLRQMPNNETKRYLVTELLKDVANNDPSRAKALAASFKAADPGWDDSEFQNSLVIPEIREAWDKPGVTADEMLSLYGRLRPQDNSWGERVEIYPPDFDFRSFLDGLNALQAERGGKLVQMPSDMLEAWSKADPQAAAEWLIREKTKTDRGNSPYFMGWRSLAQGIAARSGPQAYYQWAAGMVAQSGDKVRQMILDESSDEDLAGIMENMGDAALRTETSIGQAVRRGDIDMFAIFSTPEQRLSAIAKDPRMFYRWIARGKSDPSFWPRAGLTAEQVAAVLPEQSDAPPPICPHCQTAHY
jgi:hypothetical protein